VIALEDAAAGPVLFLTIVGIPFGAHV